MAFLQGSTTHLNDYIGHIRAFLLTNSWVGDYWVAGEVAVTRSSLVMHYGSVYFDLYAEVYSGSNDKMVLTAGTAHDTGDTLVSPSFAMSLLGIDRASMPFTFFHWDNADGSKQFLGILEYDPGKFTYTSFGVLKPTYATTGSSAYAAQAPLNTDGLLQSVWYHSPYTFAARLSNSIVVDDWFHMGYYSVDTHDLYGSGKDYQNLWYGLNAQVFRVSLAEHVSVWPYMVLCSFDGSTADSGQVHKFVAAEIPNIKLCSCLMFAPGQSTILGAEEYLVFPSLQKTAVTDQAPNAHAQYGFAIRKT